MNLQVKKETATKLEDKKSEAFKKIILNLDVEAGAFKEDLEEMKENCLGNPGTMEDNITEVMGIMRRFIACICDTKKIYRLAYYGEVISELYTKMAVFRNYVSHNGSKDKKHKDVVVHSQSAYGHIEKVLENFIKFCNLREKTYLMKGDK